MINEKNISMKSVVPILRSLDEQKAKAFYVDYLGFKIAGEHRFDEGMPLYMMLYRDGCILHVSEHAGDCQLGGAVRIETNRLKDYYEELLTRCVGKARPRMEEVPWGFLEMCLEDPFGNRIIFCEKL
ncbi:glyoxalase superfamily protein [Halalkalibacter sp. APA_J-10(15)]|uniref:glyoxalase superfamily protein n=1 Tax=Halalkalibacter sp. APA_J-10(15) TaxID=2933805 RepID=UPI001FF62A1B|nr:glyoxalase superfamily protein [Halalkalibacter sp. APA_J-10(15)]MCK0470583.1 VOC family protein [Halalkalibacter sp. APA_J-10(15)]